MKSQITDAIRITHVLEAIMEIENYLTDVTFNDFMPDSQKRFATIKQLEIIGEACSRITQGFKDKFPEIQWQQVTAFRNISIHEYFAVDLKIVWEIAKTDIPVLKRQFEKVLDQMHDS